MNLVEKQLICYFDPYFVLITTLAKTRTDGYKREILFVVVRGKNISLEKCIRGKSISEGKCNCHVLGTEGCRKLKFSGVSLQICQILLRKD